jgi:Putative DNA-binding domain
VDSGRTDPSFPEPNSAWRAFAEGDYSLSGASQPPIELARIRVAETAAWIGSVHVTATQLSAEVQGSDVEGTELELFGVADRSQRRLDGPGTVIFPLSDGLPPSAWLWLKRGMQWLDYRPIDARSGWTGEHGRAPIEIEQPVDPQANIEALIASGEGPRLEFKERLPTGPRDRKLLKGVPAFANGAGGTIIFGINSDETTVTGLSGGDATTLRDQLVNLVRAAVIPMPQVTVTPYTIDGKLILALDVEPGQSPPYGLVTSPDARDKPEFYVRRGASTYPAQPSDLRQATLASQQTSQPLDLVSRFGPW